MKGLATSSEELANIQLTSLAHTNEGLADRVEGLATRSEGLANRSEGSGQ